METYRKSLLASETPYGQDSSPPGHATNDSYRKLEIAVIVTSFEDTVAAVKRAGALLNGLDGLISLVDVQPVHHALALERPPICPDFSRRKLVEIAKESTVEVRAHIFWCRSRAETLDKVLKSASPVLIGRRRSWWPGWEKKLAKKLQRLGHEVVVLEN
jgi:hypothetical protein